MGAKVVKGKEGRGILEFLMKLVIHAMVDDAYYPDLKTICMAVEHDPSVVKKATIKATFESNTWECCMVGRKGHSSILGRALIMADCHGMDLTEYLAQCIQVGPGVMARNAQDPDACIYPEAFP
jgi:hypothetical protein